MPKTLVAVIIFDRFYNLQEWVRTWSQCQTQDCELIVIHNYENEAAKDAYKIYCDEVGIRYVPRVNIGFDIGAFQDVCNNRLEGFPSDFDYLLWCTDDVLPMKKDFIMRYVSKFQPEIGVVAMEISKVIKLHIRTTGFMIRKGLLSQLKFPADPVTTKRQCYQFEHRSHNTILEQITRLGYKSVEVENIEDSPMWDTGHNSREARRRFNRREQEQMVNFPK